MRRPDVWAGAALAGTRIVQSFRPSLMPRSTPHQALLSGAAGTTGWAIGSSLYAASARTGSGGIDTAILAGVAVLGIGTKYLIPWSADEPRALDPIRSIAYLVGSGAASAAAVSAVRGSKQRTTIAALAGIGAGTAGAISIRRGIQQQAKLRDELDFPTPNPAKALVESVGVAGILGALIGGYQQSGGAIARTMQVRLGVPPQTARYTGNVLAAAMWAVSVKAAYSMAVTGVARYDRVLDPGFDVPPGTGHCTGGPGSLVPWSRLGRQGRRFITNAPTPEDINSIMGTDASVEPVRVFVGYDGARTVEGRVALALAELKRTGAYDRKLMIVSAPAGTGYVNTLPMEVADYTMHGDVASVAIQYARLPSLLALHQTPVGAQAHRLLLEGIAIELSEMPPDDRPTVVVYGESLGAWAGQDAFIGDELQQLDALGVEKALWVGTPYYSKFRNEALADEALNGGLVEEVNAVEDLEAPPSQRRVTFLTHHNDPINLINATLFLREPPWLTQSPRKPGLPEDQVWVPMLTALQSMVDAVNATNPIPGVFRATGHDYRLDLPRVTVAAYNLPEPTAEQWAALMERFQADEADRAAAMKLGKTEILDPDEPTPEDSTGDTDAP
jgi:uncharacterized membrane protein